MWNGKEKKEKGLRQVNYLWVLAGCYLMYLGGELIYEVIQGEAALKFWSILAAVVFILVGGWLCLREWKLYRYGSKEEQEALPEDAAPEEDEELDELPDTDETSDEEE